MSGLRWRQRTTLRLDNLASKLPFKPEFIGSGAGGLNGGAGVALSITCNWNRSLYGRCWLRSDFSDRSELCHAECHR
jgi:hypothetical protein